MRPDLAEAYSEEYEEEYRYFNYFPEELMATDCSYVYKMTRGELLQALEEKMKGSSKRWVKASKKFLVEAYKEFILGIKPGSK